MVWPVLGMMFRFHCIYQRETTVNDYVCRCNDVKPRCPIKESVEIPFCKFFSCKYKPTEIWEPPENSSAESGTNIMRYVVKGLLFFGAGLVLVFIILVLVSQIS